MTETMGQIIKRLRKERNLTQEKLAEQLGVTSQAISKWENDAGMPDISQIAPLASFFDVSTDVLFGLSLAGVDAAIAEVKARSDLPETDNDQCIELWLDLMKRYPHNNECRFHLADIYLCRKQDGDYAAAAALYEKILDESTDSKLRLKSLDMLCFCYNRMGDTANAIRIAKLCGPSHITADCLLAKIDGYEQHNEVNQRLLSYCAEEAAWCLIRQAYETDADAIFACQTAIRLLDLIYYDSNKAWISYVYISIRTQLCKLLAKTEQYDEFYNELDKWLNDVIFEDSLPLGDCRYPGNIFLNLQTYRHDISPKKGLEFMLFHLKSPEYDKVRSAARFQAFLSNASKRYHERVIPI